MSNALHLHKQYVKGTPRKSIVQLVTVLVCHLPNAIMKSISSIAPKIYLNTRVIKHVYDKRPAEEFDLLINALTDIVKYPDKIYKNKDGKRGSFCFVKEIKNERCLVSIEVIESEDGESPCGEVSTFFRVEERYLATYELLWEWKGGTPSS